MSNGAPPPAPTSAVTSPLTAPMTRRKFLLRLGWGLFWVFVGGWLASLLRFLFPNVLYEPASAFKAGWPEEYEVGSISDRWKKEQRVWIVRTPDGFYALWARCTHLGCTPNWFSTENRFKCPCHGSNFSRAGDVIAGPAPKPLWRCAIRLAPDGQLFVDKGQLESKPGRREHEAFFFSYTGKT